MQLDDLSFEEARSLARPAMTYVRSQLRDRLTARSRPPALVASDQRPPTRVTGPLENPMGLLPPMRRQHVVCSLPDQGIGPVLS